jgi:uncharacterized protein YbcV (DUF1398 family)
MDRNVLQEHLRGSFDGTTPFPELVGRLRAAGVSRYDTDLLMREKRFYGTDDVMEAVALPAVGLVPVAEGFSADGVTAALTERLQHRINYAEFLRRIMAAGTVSYSVFVNGGKAIYLGRDGDVYVQPLPPRP